MLGGSLAPPLKSVAEEEEEGDEIGETKQEESERHFGAGAKSISTTTLVVGVMTTVGNSLMESWAVKATFDL